MYFVFLYVLGNILSMKTETNTIGTSSLIFRPTKMILFDTNLNIGNNRNIISFFSTAIGLVSDQRICLVCLLSNNEAHVLDKSALR